MISIKKEIVEILKQRWEPPKVFENAISEKDVEFLLNDEELNQNKRILPLRVFGLDTTRAQKYLKPVLDSILTYPYKVTGGNYFRTEIPYRIHADTGLNDDAKLYRIVVFPLYVNTDGKPYLEENNSLAVLNQRWFNQAAFFMKGEEEKFKLRQNEYNIPTNEYHLADGLTENPFPKEIFEKDFNHLAYSNFDGFSILSSSVWRIGNAITFDRSNIHVASNFFNANVKMKIGLTFFTEYADI